MHFKKKLQNIVAQVSIVMQLTKFYNIMNRQEHN